MVPETSFVPPSSRTDSSVTSSPSFRKGIQGTFFYDRSTTSPEYTVKSWPSSTRSGQDIFRPLTSCNSWRQDNVTIEERGHSTEPLTLQGQTFTVVFSDDETKGTGRKDNCETSHTASTRVECLRWNSPVSLFHLHDFHLLHRKTFSRFYCFTWFTLDGSRNEKLVETVKYWTPT